MNTIGTVLWVLSFSQLFASMAVTEAGFFMLMAIYRLRSVVGVDVYSFVNRRTN